MKRIPMHDFLKSFNFSYKEIGYELDGAIKIISLVDLDDVNLENIESNKFVLSNNSIKYIIDKLNMYINDYIIYPVLEDLKKESSKNSELKSIISVGYLSKCDLPDLIDLCKRYSIKYYKIADYICNPKYIYFSELEPIKTSV